jgi:sialate O-acetylesterase
MQQWQEAHLPKDTTNTGIAATWQMPDTPDADWQDMPMPSHWEDHGLNIDGVVWLRKTFALPEGWYGKELTLQGGTIDDKDTTYFNGVHVGRMGFEVPDAYMTPRVYKIPSYVLRRGSNTIAIRVFDTGGVGGMDPGSTLSIAPTDDPAAAINLAGTWKAQVEHVATPTTQEELRRLPQAPQPPDSPIVPSTLYNGMIAPIVPYGIRGAIWYQGESNAGRAAQYRTLFPTMIRDRRSAWNRGPFSFYFVQLANFMQRRPEPTDSAWAELREAQTMTLALKNTGMAVIIDVGETNDIHPHNKEAVGERLALWALARDYGKMIEYSGPLYKSSSPERNGIRIRFDHVDGGLATMSGQDVKGFAIAGEDHKFVWANARIEGNTVFVWSDAVPKPVAVRYAWADNPECNLINKSGLPASPFRTDNWEPAKR